MESVVIPTAKRQFNARYRTPSGSYNATRMFQDASTVYNTFAGKGKEPAGPSRPRRPFGTPRATQTPTVLVKGFSKKRRGATSSKSAGRFKRGTKKAHRLDYYAKRGIVSAAEVGAVLQSPNEGPFAQSVLVGHSSYTLKGLHKIVAMALTKMVAGKLKRQLSSFTDLIDLNLTGNLILTLKYRPALNSVTQVITYTAIAGTAKWINIANFFEGQLQAAQPSYTWISLKAEDTVGQNNTNGVVMFDIDMTKCRIQLYSKSALKLQNRSINTSGNDDMDDVDNVPLYGKSYDGSGNYCIHKINADEVDILTPNVKTFHQTFGGEDYWNPVFARLNSATAGSAGGAGNTVNKLTEPPTKVQFDRVKRVGKAHMDPGHIKTSVLTDRRGFLLQSFFRMVDFFAADEQAVKAGKFRFFILEKMINAVADTATNVIRVAYELDCKIGCVASCPSISVTNYITDQMNIGSSLGGN